MQPWMVRSDSCIISYEKLRIVLVNESYPPPQILLHVVWIHFIELVMVSKVLGMLLQKLVPTHLEVKFSRSTV